MSARGGPAARFVLVSADERAILDDFQAESDWPRQDVVELAQALDAELLSYSDLRAASWFTRLVARCLGPPVALAWLAFERRGSFYFANAENTGLPLALLLKLRPGATLVVLGHRLSTPLKTGLIRAFDLLRSVDLVFCYNQTQQRHLIEKLRMPAERVQRIPFQVDDRFFTPAAEPAGRTVLSVGREMRDYATLFAALDGSGVPLTVVASSPWSRRADLTANGLVPENVTLRRNVSNGALRELYRQAAVVVVPLMNVDFPAGVTALLEAQACGRPVVISSSEGIVDAVEPGSVLTVPCGDSAALRSAILHLIEHRAEAGLVAQRGREGILRDRTLAHWLARVVKGCSRADAARWKRSGA